MNGKNENKRYGIIATPAGADVAGFSERFVAALTATCGENQPEVMVPAQAEKMAVDSISALKIAVFDAVRQFEADGANAVLLPCFESQTFLGEVEAETAVPIVSLMEALRDNVSQRHPAGGRIGILCSGRLQEERLFERHFSPESWSVLYPAADNLRNEVDAVIRGGHEGNAVERLVHACEDLVRQGAGSIVAGDTTIAGFSSALQKRGFPVVDSLQVYADYAASAPIVKKAKPFKIGIVGGVGPAATVDFLDKIVRNTPAARDQDHLKVVVEQNPQIPDRTANLLGQGADPTIAIYATCKRLEADGADIITIPCNTAHAFVARIQPFLSIPIVNMLNETAASIRRNHGDCSKVGLLATSGTIASRVYHEAIGAAGFELLVPDDENQQRVMNAIYGPRGVKAGFTEGECVEDLMQALMSLVLHGAEVIILGCTELPLLLAQNDAFPVAGKTVAVVDPTEILARKCVALGRPGMER